MPKVIFSVGFLLFFHTFIFAQTETLSGKIVKKEWSKTIDSYCAGGSEYYVLVQNDKEEILLDLLHWRKKKIQKSLNQTVTLKGVWQSNTKKTMTLTRNIRPHQLYVVFLWSKSDPLSKKTHFSKI